MRDLTDRDLVVETSSGSVQGFLDRGVPNWRGVPYGRVEQRFRPPVPVTPVEQVDARRWGPVCWQLPIMTGKTLSAVFPDVAESEDCLNLNLWSPDPSPDARRPVLVWLHFGSRAYGSGSTPTIDVWHFAARHGAVIVTPNYRLGPWGWLYLGALDPDFKDSANLTILDQVMLLRWIRENVAGFGGDPDNVTVFGMSSGASDLGALLGAPAAKGLFHKAALYSGAQAPMAEEDAVQFAEEFLAAAGPLAATPADLVQLPNVGLRTIHRRLLRQSTARANGPVIVRYGPFVDGDVLPQAPLDSLEAGLMADVPLLVSNVAEEAGVWDCWNAVDHAYSHVLPDADQSVDHDEKIRVLSEIRWVGPARELLAAQHKGGGHGWAQKFDYAPSTNWQTALAYPAVAKRPVHGADVASLFLDPEGDVGTDDDRAVGALEQAALLALARDGHVPWAQWSPEQQTPHRIAAPSN
ncbi:carboxylesterase family protein [Streptomyces silvisoli]|uniref:Carboxylic ester hydrolase n=1 Tax=Streptomyces silvisoli TaxID=3034235 RepID=A0ABT5ZVK8_9ACTN|nr:carboxylesterase family protein [Streptomyces silvisoli]MDF3293691.1 carboxylesterase family protein [Streptomyces silvisoli]